MITDVIIIKVLLTPLPFNCYDDDDDDDHLGWLLKGREQEYKVNIFIRKPNSRKGTRLT